MHTRYVPWQVALFAAIEAGLTPDDYKDAPDNGLLGLGEVVSTTTTCR